ncbi:S-adenosyl-L-methionine-dependent methyltransferase [Trametes sanguinea]|nr:S-adenosyl-L-methionine-dependent methyltransferase [Trametes sanguinea]
MVNSPTPESPSPTPEPVKPKEFILPPDFQRDPNATLADEFRRLVRMCGLKKKTKRYKSARRLFYGTYAAEEFKAKFGTDKGSLSSWQKLCSHLGIGENLNLGSITTCRKALYGNYVNLIDLLDTFKTNDRPKIFSSEKELAEYIRDSGKVFLLDAAKFNDLLSAFLIEVRKKAGQGKKKRKRRRTRRQTRAAKATAEKLEADLVQARQLSTMCVDAVRDEYRTLFNKDCTETMDYACGTGLFSLALCPYVKHILGVDINQASVDSYNRRATEQGFSRKMEAVCATLKGEPGELRDARFDLITYSAALHHILAVKEVTRVLAHFLKSGGSLLIVYGKSAPDDREVIPEKSREVIPYGSRLFEEEMRVAFEGAGLVDFELKDMAPIRMEPTGKDMVWFIARGTKPVESS